MEQQFDYEDIRKKEEANRIGNFMGEPKKAKSTSATTTTTEGQNGNGATSNNASTHDDVEKDIETTTNKMRAALPSVDDNGVFRTDPSTDEASLKFESKSRKSREKPAKNQESRAEAAAAAVPN